KGYLLENMIFLHLRRKSDEIYYYRTLKGLELDFYCFDKEGGRELIQVAWEMHEEKTKKRELKALFQAMEECGLKEGTIVSYMQTETIIDGENQINIVPAWKFILN
ncbi:MAG: DUF4143 domain-containing protein, partial [Bacteroidales bacterium]|nr:DUF4143 domain-containing protein [Bacteroidales bacterium]